MKLKRITIDDMRKAFGVLLERLGPPRAVQAGLTTIQKANESYFRAMDWMTPSQLRKAAEAASVHCRYFPTVSELRDYAGEIILDPPDEPTAEQRAKSAGYAAELMERFGKKHGKETEQWQ